MSKLKKLLLVFTLVIFTLVGCSSSKTDDKSSDSKEGTKTEKKVDLPKEIILATTTSTQDSGLLDELIPKFTKETGIKVKTVSVGTGQAIEMGRKGEADVLLVHAKEDEEKFVEEGYGTERLQVMYNDFILVGPKDDKLKLKENSGKDIKSALKNIQNTSSTFISRGDDSGTHKMEMKLWKEIDITPEGEWYVSAGTGMADVLKIASEKQGYTLTDRATYLSLKDNLELEILVENDKLLYNQYGVIPVNVKKTGGKEINQKGAEEFAKWITSEDTQKLIKTFGVKKYGEPLFIPNAK